MLRKRKNTYSLRSKQANILIDLQIILKLLSSRRYEQRAWIIPTGKSSGHATNISLAEFWMEMFDGGKWRRQHYFNFIFGIVAQFLVW